MILLRHYRTMASMKRHDKYVRSAFDHLVVMDFEATCDQEIIEFPAVSIRCADGSVLKEFHQYVKPKYHPQLSTFCTELTGIIQSDVDGGAPFELVLNDFHPWLISQSFTSFAVVTCGDWDLGTMLPSQCAAYNIDIPEHFRHWINIKKIFANHTGIWPRGMISMLNHFGLPLIGRHHSGIDDCRNISRIVQALLKQGAKFELTSSLKF